MHSLRYICTIAILCCLTLSSFGQHRTVDGGFTTQNISFNKTAFEQSLETSLAPQTIGYQWALIKDGQVVSEKWGGKARTGNDGNMTMKKTTPMNLGSLSKFISGTTMLHLMENPPQHMGLNYKNKSFDDRLDTPMWGELPNVWLDVIPGPYDPGPQQRNITFRKLLQHRSGFDNNWQPVGGGERDFLDYLENGFTPAQYNVREYANMNFVTVGYMIPLLENHMLNYDVDQAVSGYTAASADAYARSLIGGEMDGIIREYVTDNFSTPINFSCDAADQMANTAAYTYTSLTDQDGGISSIMNTKGHCGGEGGYYMSAHDFANYVANFSASNNVVSSTVRNKMYNETMNPDDRMVWSFVNNDSWMNTNFDMPRVVWSNGVGSGNRSALLRLPDDYYLVIFSNTRNDTAGQTTGQLYNFGVAAFKAGMDHNF